MRPAHTERGQYFYPRPPRGGRLALLDFYSPEELISIHALREEGDLTAKFAEAGKNVFLSTPSARRATWTGIWAVLSALFLSTPSARRATLEGGGGSGCVLFLSTPSARRATHLPMTPWRSWTISIHALREEGDGGCKKQAHQDTDFYPRPPRGGRPEEFQKFMDWKKISIHALREEGDSRTTGRAGAPW